MSKPTVYIETTVVSYLTAWPSGDIVRRAHEIITREWWEHRRVDFELFTSDFVIREASQGDSSAAAERLTALAGIAVLAPSPAVNDLAKKLVVALQLPPRAALDASHLAVCAVYAIDYLLTWNCTHLANGALAATIERACEKGGFKAPRILTPLTLKGVT